MIYRGNTKNIKKQEVREVSKNAHVLPFKKMLMCFVPCDKRGPIFVRSVF